jgi:transcriptional antiterminator RfaH
MGLAALGFRAFLPEITKWKSHARVQTIGKVPLFPNYLFVEADWNLQSLDAVHRTHGVHSIVNNQGVPSSIYGDFIVRLLERQLKGDFDLTNADKPPVGAKMMIMDGRYEDCIGHIERLRPNQRAELLISMMGRKVRDTLGLAQLRPAVVSAKQPAEARASPAGLSFAEIAEIARQRGWAVYDG